MTHILVAFFTYSFNISFSINLICSFQHRKYNASEYVFTDISPLLPKKSLLIFNETKVIPARLSFHKQTGASIDIMLLNPVAPSRDINITMGATKKVTWKCMIKNLIWFWKGKNVIFGSD